MIAEELESRSLENLVWLHSLGFWALIRGDPSILMASTRKVDRTKFHSLGLIEFDRSSLVKTGIRIVPTVLLYSILLRVC